MNLKHQKMKTQYIEKCVWKLGAERRKQKGSFWGAIASAAVPTLVDSVARNVFGRGR